MLLWQLSLKLKSQIIVKSNVLYQGDISVLVVMELHRFVEQVAKTAILVMQLAYMVNLRIVVKSVLLDQRFVVVMIAQRVMIIEVSTELGKIT